MTYWIKYGGMSISCINCRANHTNCTFHILWTNQYGASIRVFCHKCGAMSDRTLIRGKKMKRKCRPMRMDLPPLPWQPGYVKHSKGK